MPQQREENEEKDKNFPSRYVRSFFRVFVHGFVRHCSYIFSKLIEFIFAKLSKLKAFNKVIANFYIILHTFYFYFSPIGNKTLRKQFSKDLEEIVFIKSFSNDFFPSYMK